MRKVLHITAIFLLCLTVEGCLHTKYPIRTQYMLDIKNPQKIQLIKPEKVLEVVNTSIASQFSSINFIYRINNINYIADYYNVFFSPPDRQIDQIITNYLSKTNLFTYVTNDDDYDKSHYTLHSKILELYADYRDKKNPKAIISIQFTLFKPDESQTTILINKTFKEKIILAKKDSQNLIHGWNKGLEKILKNLTKEIYKRTNV